MKFFYLSIFIFLVVLSTFSSASEEAHNFLQVNWVAEDPSGAGVNPDGWGLLSRVDISEHWFVRGEYEDLAGGGVDVEAAEVVLAYVLNPHQSNVFHIGASYGFERESSNGSSNKDIGRGIELGFHSDIGYGFVLHGEAAWETGNGQEVVGGELGLFYQITELLGINLEYSFDENSNSAVETGIRFTF